MIKRYSYNDCVRGMLEGDDGSGEYVTYSDFMSAKGNYKKRTSELKAEIEKLKEQVQEAYNKGYDEGRWVGYHELSQDLGVVDFHKVAQDDVRIVGVFKL